MAKLIILMGLPGSGKSYYAKLIQQADADNTGVVIHSSDAIREELFGDPNSQENNSLVFEVMHRRTQTDLRKGLTVVFDATNITRKARRGAINLASKDDIVEGHIVWAPIEVCRERDAKRERTVGIDVIDKMIRRWQSPWYDEGFHKLRIYCSDYSFDHILYVARTVNAMHIPHDNPHHTLGVYEHCDMAYQKMLELLKDKSGHQFLRNEFSCLPAATYWHDIGKPYTKFYKKKTDSAELDLSRAYYYDHHCVGGYLAYGLFIPKDTMTTKQQEDACFTSWLIATHMDPFFDTKYYRALCPRLRTCIDLLHEADLQAH